MLKAYKDPEQYDLTRSFVIGDRHTDIELAHNLNAKGILIAPATPENLLTMHRGLLPWPCKPPLGKPFIISCTNRERKVVWERNTKKLKFS